jgi:uncharacterized FlaG/YvyC family protein
MIKDQTFKKTQSSKHAHAKKQNKTTITNTPKTSTTRALKCMKHKLTELIEEMQKQIHKCSFPAVTPPTH